MVTITAQNTGFHILSATDQPLSPDVLLYSLADPDGTMVWRGDAWVHAGSLSQPGSAITADARAPVQTGPDSGTITFTGLDFARVTDGQATAIGSLSFDTTLTVTATRLPEGPGNAPVWQADLGAALRGAISTEGLTFLGGAGADVYDPATDVLPIRGPVVLLGGGGDDILHAGRADATLRGGSGDDTLSIQGNGTIWGGAGDDMIHIGMYATDARAYGGTGADVMTASNGADMLAGNQGTDRIDGGRGDDHLRGGMGNDRLEGADGADMLRGGPGDDVLSGGADADRFVFRATQDGHDVITDFDTEDMLVLHGLEAGDTVTQIWQGDDLVIRWGSEDASITLEDYTQLSLNEDQFLY